MTDWQERVIKEHTTLQNNIERLATGVSKIGDFEISPEDAALLYDQLAAMASYGAALCRRIQKS